MAILLAGCGSNPESGGAYLVKRGDTLYSIATRHKLDYKDLARWNGIGRDYTIQVGQTLRLSPPGGKGRSVSARSGASTKSRSQPPPPRAVTGPPVQWQWPVAGGAATLTTRPNGGHGLMIVGTLGEDVRAAGAGKIVYTGSGLLGYGQLIIVKHNESYLSAYGHLQSVLMKEGEAVAVGQKIATMGNGPQGSPMLYFEIRVNGSPGNPLALLPQRRDVQ